jgi:hypothetical protein
MLQSAVPGPRSVPGQAERFALLDERWREAGAAHSLRCDASTLARFGAEVSNVVRRPWSAFSLAPPGALAVLSRTDKPATISRVPDGSNRLMLLSTRSGLFNP